MKYTIISLFILCSQVACTSGRKEQKQGQKQESVSEQTFYPSGKLKSEFEEDSANSSKRNTTYYESGKISAVQNYTSRSGHFRSENTHYYESGHIAVHSVYEDGMPIGRVYAEYQDGKLSYEQFYQDGYKTGAWKSFNPDGSLKEETSFTGAPVRWDDDKINATTQYYYKREVAYTVVYSAGRAGEPQIANQEAYEQLIAVNPVNGETLFMSNCIMCHTKKSEVIAPVLKGVGKKRSEKWLAQMIVNGEKLRQDGDPEVAKLFKKWPTLHPNYERLTEEEVRLLIQYIKSLD
jgi:antitoxin component YwqK of YwqJK toxin-antitoxin module